MNIIFFLFWNLQLASLFFIIQIVNHLLNTKLLGKDNLYLGMWNKWVWMCGTNYGIFIGGDLNLSPSLYWKALRRK